MYEVVASLCLVNNLSISKLEKELDIGNGTIGKWKQGAKPNLATLEKIAVYFGIPLSDLVRGE